MKTNAIEEIGYDTSFARSCAKLGYSEDSLARVLAEHKGRYRVRAVQGDREAHVTGSLAFRARSRDDYPAVGDWVALDTTDDEKAVIRAILPRKTLLKRKRSGGHTTQLIAANIDVAFIVESVDRDYSINRYERYCAIARDSGIVPVAILNKVDLISDEEKRVRAEEMRERLGNDVSVLLVSTETGEGLDGLKKTVEPGKTYCFLGSSGVGKSSLINTLLGEERLRTGDISTHANRGKHVTTHREMFFLKNSGIVIDNPGVREVGLTDVSAGITKQFREITNLGTDCKFSDCTHTNEPGCEVRHALKTGAIDEHAYENYTRTKREAEHYEMTNNERREKDKKFGKFIKRTKKDLKRAHHKNYGL